MKIPDSGTSVMRIKYHDFWIKIIGSLVFSQIVDFLNRNDSLIDRFSSIYYYTDLVGGFIIALIIWEFVSRITIWLDSKFDWFQQTIKRLVFQTLLGVATPSIACFYLTLLFLKLAYNQDIYASSYPFNEIYVVVLITLFINFVYFAWWMYHKIKFDNALQQNQHQPQQTISAVKAKKNFLISPDDIACFYLENNIIYIKNYKNEIYISSSTIKSLSKILTDASFFQVNRQVIINRNAVKAYQSIENGKINIELIVPFQFSIIVSQKRAKEFRKWVFQNHS